MQLKYIEIGGRVTVALVGIVLILAGVLKLVGVGADDMVEGLEKARLDQHLTLISAIAIVCGVLLVVPRIWPFGVLMSTAYWGGAIVAHLTYDDSVAMPASFLVTLWIGTGACVFSKNRRGKSDPLYSNVAKSTDSSG